MFQTKQLLKKLQTLSEFRSWKNTNKEEYQMLVKLTNYLSSGSTIRQRIWHLQNGIDIPKCGNPQCLTIVKWNDTKHKYQTYCSNECVHIAGNLLPKRQKTNQNLYGHNNFFGSKFGKKIVKEKMKDKYGVEHALQSQDIINKLKNTNQEKYGANSFLGTNESKIVRAAAVLKLGGQKELNKRISKTKKSKISSSFEYWKSVTNNRWNQENLDQLFEAYVKLNDIEWLKEQNKVKSLTQISKELNVSQPTVSYAFSKYNISVINNNSQPQNEILDFIKQNYFGDVISNTRKIIPPYEIDIWLPNIRIAIELNGVFWHSELSNKDRNYHYNKTIMCEQQNIKCIHIFDQEWILYPDLIKSKILHLLQKTPQTIYARNCIVQKIDFKTTKQFLDENHIQQTVNSTIQYGLMHKNLLVSLMTFGRPRFNTKYQFEMLRFCSKQNTSVVGGASKLFQHFIETHNPTSIISYCDRRWGTGELYSNLNFQMDGITKPNYFYFKRTPYNPKFLSRLQFQKHKLVDKLESFDPELTEWQNMQANGYDRIWDCGNSRWIWTNPST